MRKTQAAESPAVRMERLPALGPNVHRGVCFAHSYQSGGAHGYGSDASRTQLEEVRGRGANWVSVTPVGCMPALESHEAGADPHPTLPTKTDR